MKMDPTNNQEETNVSGKEKMLNRPTLFTGDQTKIQTFIQECNMYLAINRKIYDDNPSKIAFMLSFITDGEALQWKEQFVKLITGANLSFTFPTCAEFVGKLLEVFKEIDQTGAAMNKLQLL